MSKRFARFFTLIMGMALLMGFLAACGTGTGGNSGTSGTTIIKIAADLPTSGAAASNGVPTQNGVQMAIDEANAQNILPGYKFVADFKDDVGASGNAEPAVGAANVSTLISDAEVAGLVGPFNSSVAVSEMPISNNAPLAQISPSNTNTCLTQDAADTGCVGANDILSTVRPTGKVSYFRVATTDNHQGGVGANYAFKTLGYKKAFVIDDTTVYGVGIAKAFVTAYTADGGTVLGHDSIAVTTDYSAELTKIAHLNPDVIYFAGLDSTGGIPLRKQMENTPGLKQLPFMGGDGLQSSAFASAIGTGANSGGPVYSSVATIDATKVSSSIASTFIKNYQAKYGTLGSYSGAGYDCAWILLDAVKAAVNAGGKAPASSDDAGGANTFRQDVINQLAKTNYNGVTGHQSFDSNGDTTNKTITVYKLGDVSGKPGWVYVTAQTLS